MVSKLATYSIEKKKKISTLLKTQKKEKQEKGEGDLNYLNIQGSHSTEGKIIPMANNYKDVS